MLRCFLGLAVVKTGSGDALVMIGVGVEVVKIAAGVTTGPVTCGDGAECKAGACVEKITCARLGYPYLGDIVVCMGGVGSYPARGVTLR